MINNFENYYEKFMEMKKADIIREGQIWDVWARYDSTTKELMKSTKNALARTLADRLVRRELRGY